MAFPGSIYAPPGVYTRTRFEDPTAALLSGLRLPIYIGVGSEVLTEVDLELVRGSSSSVDQRIVGEDLDGRAVVSVSVAGLVTLGNFDGLRRRVQVRNFPIVTGDGTGTTTTSAVSVSVTINDQPIVVLSIDGANGILELSTPPQFGDTVRATYFFNRTDTMTTDDVSAQITTDTPLVIGAIGESFEITTDVNNTLVLSVDQDDNIVTITLPQNSPGLPWSASQIAAFINSSAVGTTLFAGTTTNNHGDPVVTLTAASDVTVGNGTANSTLGLTNGSTTGRNRTFLTFQGPIVDGSNGGVTTTDPADVTVRVDGTAVVPVSVNGTNRSVTLPFAPALGATVSITYFFNSWQDTFDYLAHRQITDVLRAGIAPDRSDFIDGVDFVLQNDLLLWGTAAVVSVGEHTAGTEFFQGSDAEGGGQITPTLVDVKQFLAQCNPVTDTTVSPPVTSTRQFQLPLLPTTGNGRNSPLGSSLFQTVSNGRIDLPTNRPDLVDAYVGFSLQDAIERGAVTVTAVESETATITLQDPIQVGMQVFATFFYNTIGDQRYTLTVEEAGAAGVGTYTISDPDGSPLLTTTFGSKGASLAGIDIVFPSGSEQLPDARHEQPFRTTFFEGGVEEDVTVTFRNKDSTLAKFTVAGSGPYFPISSASDHIKIDVDGNALDPGAAGLDLSAVNGEADLGFAASLVGDEIEYNADTGLTEYTIDATNNEINLTIDGVLVSGKANVGTIVGDPQDLGRYVDAINRAAVGETGTAVGPGTGLDTIELENAASTNLTSTTDDYYVGWTIEITAGAGSGQSETITAYDAATFDATVSAPWGIVPDGTSVYVLKDPSSLPAYTGAARFTSPVTIVAGEYDSISFHYTGDVTGGTGDLTATIAAGTYNSATLLAAAWDTAFSSVVTAFGVSVSANADGQMVFTLSKDPNDASGYLEFITQGDAQASGTATVLSFPTTGTITVGGVTLNAAGGPRTPGSDDYDNTLGSAQLIADDIVAAINDALNSFVAIATADNVGGTTTTITLTAVPTGAAGNAVTLVESTSGVEFAVSGATFTGGSDAGANDFSVLGGMDTDTATAGGQTKLIDGLIARRFTVAGNATGSLRSDRLVLRNRLIPGSSSMHWASQVGQAGIVVEGSTASDNMGLTVSDVGVAGIQGTVQKASILGIVGFSNGQATGLGDERDGQPLLTFYADGGTNPQNNVFKVTVDDVPVTVEFTDAAGTAIALGGSADVPMGPVSPTVGVSILSQIQTAITASGSTAVVQQEGAGFRIVSGLDTTAGTIDIGTGNANDDLGLIDGSTSSRVPVAASVLASALMSHTQLVGAGFIAAVANDWANPAAATFAGEALARVQTDAANASYLYVQSLGNVALGVGSSIAWDTPTINSVLLPGVGLRVADGDGSSGEAGISGFFVTSSDTVNGSGTGNTSSLNDGSGGSGIGAEGSGQDGVVGQTYRDAVTGLTFTVLPREGNINYPGAALTDSFVLRVRRVVTTDSNKPVLSIPGLQLLVTNTLGIGVGDTSLVETFNRNGAEPAVGDIYYVTYEYQKQDFQPRLFTKFSAVEAEYGRLSPDNPVTLAAYLALLNGAVLVGVKQVEKDQDADGDGIPDTASVQAFMNSVDDLEGTLQGGILPDILVALRGDSADLFDYMTRHADIQSSIRYRAERTIVAGVSAGTQPADVQNLATGINRTRFRVVYPDIATMTLPRADGNDEETLVDGTMIASALAGAVVSPNVDVATPWTNRRLIGFNQLARVLDAVEQNQVAVRGVTVVEDRPPFLRVRQGLTSQAQDRLLRLPTIQLIVDETQRQARATLERFIGIKFLPGVLSQIEGQLSNTLKLLVDAQILNAYTGVRANASADDPTVIEAEAFIQPVFPVLYIVITFNLRSQL